MPFELFQQARGVAWSTGAKTAPPRMGGRRLATRVDAIWETGESNVVPGLDYANHLSHCLMNRPTDSLGQLRTNFHAYNSNRGNTVDCGTGTSTGAGVAPVAASVRLSTGKLGWDDCRKGFIDEHMASSRPGVSYLGSRATWNPFSCRAKRALITSYDGTCRAISRLFPLGRRPGGRAANRVLVRSQRQRLLEAVRIGTAPTEIRPTLDRIDTASGPVGHSVAAPGKSTIFEAAEKSRPHQ